MSDGGDWPSGSADHPSYFFLSYAHSPPLAGSPLGQPDEWVRAFFRDLRNAVAARAAPQSGIIPGFYDQEIPLGLDWKTALTRALGMAEVFVPLYSPGYLTRSLPGREWSCFERRMRSAGIAEPLRRFAPVLWIPLPSNQRPQGLREARELAPVSVARAYLDNGLLALLRLAPYRDAYELIVGRLAGQIVELAERAPVAPSPVADIDQVPNAFAAEARAMTFAVVVAVPEAHGVRAGDDVAGAGQRAVPGEQVLPLAQHAAMVAEQFDFAVQVTDMESVGDLFSRAPGIILIDPQYIADSSRFDSFLNFIRDMPSWVLPILVSIPDQDAEATHLAQHVLAGTGISRSGAARYALRGVSRLQDFINLLPAMVTEAEREYLRHGPVRRFAAKPVSRPRLTGAGKPDDYITVSHNKEKRAEETPDV